MKLYKMIGCVLLAICSTIYAYRQPETITKQTTQTLYVTLSGAFLYTGSYQIHEGMTMGELVSEVGIHEDACTDALDMSRTLHAEESFYLPMKSEQMISLNKATKEELMTLKGIGEKTAERIIAYRDTSPFTCLEDVMKVKGIGEKRYLQYRDLLCL